MTDDCPECAGAGRLPNGAECPICSSRPPAVPVERRAVGPAEARPRKIPVPDWQFRAWTLPDGARA